MGVDSMNAVATKPRARAAHEQHPDRAHTMRADLLQVDRLLSQAHDACEESSTTDVLLDHLIDDLLPDTMNALRADDLHQGVTAKAYDDLFLPLALLDSIVTINAAQVLHATLAAAHMLLDEVHTSLDVAGWTQNLPEPPPEPAMAEPPTQLPHGVLDAEEEDRLQLAREVNLEIQKLSEALVKLLDVRHDEDFPMYHGILQRISLLTDINFHAMRLDEGNPPESVARLRSVYRGFYR